MRVAICDGDGEERKKYLDIFQSMAKKNNIEAEFVLYPDCEEMLFHFEDKKLMDVLITDIQMPNMSGIDAAKKLRKSDYKGEIIFLTKLKGKEHILFGYDVRALHYIIKDETSPEKIEKIFIQAKKAVEYKQKKYMLFTAANEWINVPIESIRYFETYKRIATVYYGDDKFEFHLYKFEDLEKQLEGTDFIRIHRSYLVALKEIKTFSFNTLTTRNGKTLPVGRKYYPKVKEALKNFEQIHTVIKRN